MMSDIENWFCSIISGIEQIKSMNPIHIEKSISQVVSQMETETAGSMKDYFESKLKEKLEGKFMKEGYVIPDSLRVKDMSAGTIISESLSCDLSYTILIEADIIHPVPGNVLKGKIQDKNKLGMRIVNGPLDIIMAYVHHQNEDDLKEKEIGDELEVVIAACKYQIGDSRQSVIAIWTEDPNSKEYMKK